MIPFLFQHRSPIPSKNTALGVTGDTTVIKNILNKKTLLEKGDATHEKIKPLLLLSPGAMGGAIEAGVAVALEKLQLLHAFDTVLGISAGAAVGYYALAGESAVGSQIIYKDLIEHQVVSYKHPHKFLDVDGIEKIIRSKNINTQKLKDTRSDFYVLVTTSVTGEPTLLNVKQQQDMVSTVIASMCLPILDGGKEVLINGRKYVDGAASNALPLSLAVETFQPTDILVVLPVSLKKTKGI
jgi:predicted acylesterase/phospholipase RssA